MEGKFNDLASNLNRKLSLCLFPSMFSLVSYIKESIVKYKLN